MKFIIVGKNIEVTEGLRTAVEDKIGKLEKYFAEETEIHVTLSVEKDRQKIEVTIPMKGSIIRSEQVSSDMYVSIDLVEEIIERQLKKYKTKLTDRQQAEKCRSSGQRNSILSRCTRKMPVYRWNFSDITFSYSAMRKPIRSMSYIREREIPTDYSSRNINSCGQRAGRTCQHVHLAL